MSHPRHALWKLVGIGLAAGLLSGAFGVGGGVLIVPAVVLLLGFAQRLASGTSLAAVVPIAVTGVVGYLLVDGVDVAVAGLLVAGTVVGAVVGARLLSRVPQAPLRWAFVAFMVLSAARLPFDVPERDGTLVLTVALGAALVGLGLVTGVLSGLLGVGGGVFLVPVLILLLEMSDVVAKGTSLLAVVPTGIVATWVSTRRGNVDLRAATAIGLAGVPTSLLGTVLAVRMSPQVSAILFAVFLLAVSARMALHAVRAQRSPEAAPPVPATTPKGSP